MAIAVMDMRGFIDGSSAKRVPELAVDALNREGSPSSWRQLLEVRPELGKYRRQGRT